MAIEKKFPSDLKGNSVLHLDFIGVSVRPLLHTQPIIGKLHKLKFGALKSSFLASLLILIKTKQMEHLHY